GCTGLTHLPEDLEVAGSLNLSDCTALTSLSKGLKLRGDLNLYKCIGLTHLPEDLTVGHDLTLSGCTGLTHLPEDLEVAGSLDLSDCTGLTHFSEDLEVGFDLDLSQCTALTSLPKRLKVGGWVALDGCTRLTYLPEDLEIGKDLTLSGCTALTSLSKGLKIKGGLDLSGCIGLTQLPENLEIRHSLNLSQCTALTSLPKGLKVGGRLDLSGCKELIHLSEDLEVGENLDLCHCTALTSLPKKLKVEESLNLSYCKRLTYLPEGLEVGYDLDLCHCIALTSLPRGLKVKKNLNARGCTGLTHLPEDLEIGEDLNLSQCIALTSLPKGLKVEGNLDLSECIGLTHLPEDLEVEYDLNLSQCIALTALPHSLKFGGNLDLSECIHLTSLPSWITTLSERLNGSLCIIDLTGCGLSPTVIRRLQEDTYNSTCIQFHFSMDAADDYIIEFSTLLPAIEFWQEEASQEMSITPEEICHQLHQILTQVQDHENLLTFLIRLTGTADYYNSSTRVSLAIRVIQMLQLMVKDKKLCHHAAFLIHQGLSSCDDRVMGVLDDIGFYQTLCDLERASVTEEELKTAGRGFFLFEKLNKKIREYIKTLKFVDEVEVYMAFHTALKEMLTLPIETKGMLFRPYLDISDEEIIRVGEEVLQEVTEDAWITYLAAWDPWIRYQRRISTIQWELLPAVERALSSIDICPYLQDTPIKPVLYNNTVYDYDAFIRRYIEEGVDLYGIKVVINQLFRLKIAAVLELSSNTLDRK
ncbi:MAG: NEL-type E3 ubiquitin ligase domain-containing protein, partial [Candidatus Rhabdochlamydia sp.]